MVCDNEEKKEISEGSRLVPTNEGTVCKEVGERFLPEGGCWIELKFRKQVEWHL